ncbi:MAG: cytochrome C oxidase subunit II [Bacillota bacterium]|nr:cytochrome C oxidase subunit II [Bacillota bacterium]REJ35441.1 MAG: cytochrome C oxidase subunit II [Bacillota bacterium]
MSTTACCGSRGSPVDIDRLERFWIMISIAVLAALMLAIVYSVRGFGVEVPTDVGQVDPRTARETEPFNQPGVRQVGPGHYEVVMLAEAWRFEPSEVRVPAGSTVTFRLTSLDVIHGFRIPNTNVNLMVQPGQVVEATHRFNEPGTYHLFCHEYCGAGHHIMDGMLIVER